MRYQTLVLEGLEGAGKTTVCESLVAALGARGIASELVPEFSDSLLGEYLTERLGRNKFLLDPTVPSSAFTQLYSVAADTAYAFEYAVRNAHRSGAVAIKDRGRESVAACQALAFVAELGMAETEAFTLAEMIARHIPTPVPTLACWLEVPLDVRLKRLAEREEVDGDERAVYDLRARAYEHLRSSSNWGWSMMDVDGTLDIESVTSAILHQVLGT